MTLEEAQEGLNREQRRFLAKLVKSGLEPLVARQRAMDALVPKAKDNVQNGPIGPNKTISAQKRFIRKSNG
jgi:hypothetical protein